MHWTRKSNVLDPSLCKCIYNYSCLILLLFVCISNLFTRIGKLLVQQCSRATWRNVTAMYVRLHALEISAMVHSDPNVLISDLTPWITNNPDPVPDWNIPRILSLSLSSRTSEAHFPRSVTSVASPSRINSWQKDALIHRVTNCHFPAGNIIVPGRIFSFQIDSRGR